MLDRTNSNVGRAAVEFNFLTDNFGWVNEITIIPGCIELTLRIDRHLYQRPLALTRNSLTVMARLVRAIRHRTGLNRMVRTSRAMTVLGQHRSPVRAAGIRELGTQCCVTARPRPL
jgi:hypothetical protein